MCLTIPKQVISIKNNLVKLKSKNGLVNATSIFKVKKGDWVLTQNIVQPSSLQAVRHGSLQSVIIKKITKKQALEINKLLNDYSSRE